jgi:pSer/pThr/pTyr-binding forkhead associated (FHA) protein
MNSTNSDMNQWLITDSPTHFREWDAGRIHELPAVLAPMDHNYTIGAADDCWLQLRDPTGRVSRHHARLTHDCEGRLVVSDLRSKNGVTLDGARQTLVPVVPAVELGIGGITLIVESPLLRELRELLARWIGWSDERRLNLAVRSVRMAVTRRESLRLCGGDDRPSLLSVARLLHLRTIGPDRPFVISARRPSKKTNRQRWATYKGVPRYENGLEALAAANGGTLCIGPKPPRDLAQVMEAHRDPKSRVQLIVCSLARQHDPLIAPIVLPPMAERAHELDRIIDAYAVDAGAPPEATLSAEARAVIRRQESRTLAKIEEATQRYVANELYGTTRAAELLGRAHSSISEWLARRTLENTAGRDDDEDDDDDDDDDDGDAT